MTNLKNFQRCLALSPLYGITARQYIPEGNVTAFQKMAEAGLKVIQYREKSYGYEQQLAELKEIKKIALKYEVFLIVNDSPELSLEIEADGLHLGQDDTSIEAAKKIVGTDLIIGVSTHNVLQLKKAIDDKADYVGIGPAYPSQTKSHEKTAGLEYIREAIKLSSIPCIALGGITEKRLPEIFKLGVNHICIVKDFLESEDLSSKHRRIKSIALRY